MAVIVITIIITIIIQSNTCTSRPFSLFSPPLAFAPPVPHSTVHSRIEGGNGIQLQPVVVVRGNGTYKRSGSEGALRSEGGANIRSRIHVRSTCTSSGVICALARAQFHLCVAFQSCLTASLRGNEERVDGREEAQIAHTPIHSWTIAR